MYILDWTLTGALLLHGLIGTHVTVDAAYLFQGATIVTIDPATSQVQIWRNGSLLVENDRITQVTNETISPILNGTEIIDATGKIITPGFVDAHHHLWETSYKTIASNTTLADYYQKYGEYGPSIEHFTPDDKYISQLMGCLALLNAGTTTVVDHAHGDSSNETADAILNATIESGVRAYHAFSIHYLPNNYTFDDQINKINAMAQDERMNHTSLVQLGMSYDWFSLAPAADIERVVDVTKSLNLSVLTAHFLGGPWGFPNSPILLDQYGIMNTSIPVIISHAAFIEAPDAKMLRETNQYVSSTPESQAHYGHGDSSTYLIQDQVALGLDTHFTFSTDMVTQARFWLQQLRHYAYDKTLDEMLIPVNNPMSVQQAFHLITRAGGLALRRDDIGVIRAGAKADLVVFNGDSPNMIGWSDPVAAVILHSNVGDMQHVMVDGNFVKRNGSLTFPNYNDVKTHFLESSAKIQKIWAETDWPPLTGAFFNVTPYGPVAQIDTLRGQGTGY